MREKQLAQEAKKLDAKVGGTKGLEGRTKNKPQVECARRQWA